MFTSFYHHFLRCLYSLSDSEPWQNGVVAMQPFAPWAVVALLALGIFIGFKSRFLALPWENARIVASTVGILALLSAVWGGFNLFIRAGLGVRVATVVLVLAGTLALLAAGFMAGMHLQRYKAFRWYLAMCCLLGAAVYLFVNLSGGISAPSLTKAGLKKAFGKTVGRQPDDEDKRWFWQTTVGEEAPSERKRNSFWREEE